MIFTREQIEEIRRRLKVFGSKDTEFPLAHVPLTGEEFLAIVQDGINKRATIAALYFGFNQYLEALRKEIYDYIDAIIAINNLETPDANIISISDDGTLNNYTVSKPSRLIEKGDTNIVITLQPNTGYYFNPTSIEEIVTVSMVDDDLEGNIDIQGGKDNIITIIISKVTGNITIEAETQAYEYNIFLYNPNNSGIWKCGDEPITTESVKHKYDDEEKVYTFYKNSDVEFIDNDKFEFNTEGNFEPPTGITVDGTSIRVYHITDSVGITPRTVTISNATIINSANSNFTVHLYDSEYNEVQSVNNEFSVTIGDTYTLELSYDSTIHRVSTAPKYNDTIIEWSENDLAFIAKIAIADSSTITITGELTELPKIIKASAFKGFTIKEKVGNDYVDLDVTGHIQYNGSITIKLVKDEGKYVKTSPYYTIVGQQASTPITVGQDVTVNNITEDITIYGEAVTENRIFYGFKYIGDYGDPNDIVNSITSSDFDSNQVVTSTVQNIKAIPANGYDTIFIALPPGANFPSIVNAVLGTPVYNTSGVTATNTVNYNEANYTIWLYDNTSGATVDVDIHL